MKQPDLDFPASYNDLSLAVEAARARGVAARDVHAFVFNEDLLPPGFGGTRHAATITALDALITTVAPTMTPQDELLFIASNHGDEDGLLMSTDSDEFTAGGPRQVMKPIALQQSLDRVQGPQILIIATCFSGLFLPLASRTNRVVLTACDATSRYYLGISDEDVPHSPFLRLLLGAWTGAEIPFGSYDRLPARPLPAAFDHAKTELLSRGRQCPQMSGSL